jgi:hypothetical protein
LYAQISYPLPLPGYSTQLDVEELKEYILKSIPINQILPFALSVASLFP